MRAVWLRTLLTVAFPAGELVGPAGRTWTTAVPAVPLRARRDEGCADSGQRGQLTAQRADRGVGSDDLNGCQHAVGESGLTQCDQAVVSGAGSGLRAWPRLTDRQPGREAEQGAEDRQPSRGGEQAVPDNQAGPGLPAAARPGRPAATCIAEPPARAGQYHRQQCQGDHGTDERDEQARVSEAAQERDGQQDQGKQAGSDDEPAEGDGTTCCAHRPGDRILIAQAAGTLLTPPADHQQ